jgi:hypothetical protein
MPDSLLIWIIAIVAIFVVFSLWRRKQVATNSTPLEPTAATATRDDGGVIREFKNVFFNLTEHDQERLISRWMSKSSCSRTEAMRSAVEEWRSEQQTWR